MKKIVIGILAHVDAGKTTLAEALLYNAGAIRAQGRVDHRNTALDTHRLEKDRGITIFAGVASFVEGDTEITLLDTPGHVDFSAETERTLRVLDYAILVISANEGMQAHTRTVWKLLEIYGIPTFIFVTKCDMERRSREQILEELRKEFGNAVDFTEDSDKIKDEERAAMCDELLLEEYLSCGKASERSLSAAIKGRKIFPCFFGSGLKNDGVAEFSAAMAKYTEQREYPEKFGAMVYKITHDKNERLTNLRVTGGAIKVKDTVEYSGVSEKINQIRIYSGAKYVTVDEAPAGTVCAVCGLTKTSAGEGLGIDKGNETSILEPVIRYRIVLPENCDAREVFPKFKSIEEEEPKLNITYNERLGEFHCALMGKIQAEIFKSIVNEKLGLNIEITEGKVIYKETVSDTVEGVGHYEPLRHYAEVHLLLEPAERNSGLIFATRCSEDELDRNWQRLILTHLAEKTHMGVLTGSPITDMKISLVGGRYHHKHTEGGDFRQSTYRAVRQGLMQAQSVLLEPYYNFRLEIPSSLIGRAISDIKLKGGHIDIPENYGEIVVLRGKAPVVTMDGYMTEVAAYSSGRGTLSLEYAGYDVCHNEEEVIKQAAYEPEHDLDNPADSVFCAHGAGFNVKWNEVKNYMHVESFFSSRKEERAHRSISIDEKELEAILLREFGPVKTELYRPHVRKEVTKSDSVTEIKKKCLIVDGYNVIFALFNELAQEDLEGARIKLCRILSNYALYTGCRLIVVFDGYRVSENPGEKFEYHGISVAFTKENETGDMYIERIINEIGSNENVRVVTSDAMIQLSAVHSGVMRMSVAEFNEELERVDAEIAEFIEKNNNPGRF